MWMAGSSLGPATSVWMPGTGSEGGGLVAGPVGAAADGTPKSKPPTLAILEECYARGEIDRDEFLARKHDLGLT